VCLLQQLRRLRGRPQRTGTRAPRGASTTRPPLLAITNLQELSSSIRLYWDIGPSPSVPVSDYCRIADEIAYGKILGLQITETVKPQLFLPHHPRYAQTAGCCPVPVAPNTARMLMPPSFSGGTRSRS
jgi:hypothetical protein